MFQNTVRTNHYHTSKDDIHRQRMKLRNPGIQTLMKKSQTECPARGLRISDKMAGRQTQQQGMIVPVAMPTNRKQQNNHSESSES